MAAALPTLMPLHRRHGALTLAGMGHRHHRRGPSVDLTVDSLDSSEHVRPSSVFPWPIDIIPWVSSLVTCQVFVIMPKPHLVHCLILLVGHMSMQ